MRKMWANIVNRKFKELGLDREISEKSLAAQRQDLLNQGRFEEAEKLDLRSPVHDYFHPVFTTGWTLDQLSPPSTGTEMTPTS